MAGVLGWLVGVIVQLDEELSGDEAVDLQLGAQPAVHQTLQIE